MFLGKIPVLAGIGQIWDPSNSSNGICEGDRVASMATQWDPREGTVSCVYALYFLEAIC
jgi:hypothetical protein